MSTADLGANAVTEGKIGTGAVTEGKIGTAAVTADKIGTGAVTAGKIGTGAVGTDNIANGSVTSTKLAADAAVTSLNLLTGGVSISGGTDINITQTGSDILIEYTGTLAQTQSSIRWKTNVQPLKDAVEVVKRLRGVSFEWKEDGREDIGLIAEEVGAVIPEIVVFEENGVDAKSVNYSRLVSVLIEAVKEQQEQLDGRERAIDEMTARLDRLERLVASSSSTAAPAQQANR